MKIKNEKAFGSADKKLGLQKISADEIQITYVDDIWDGPLSGNCIWKQSECYFFTFNRIEGGEEKWPRTYVLIKMNLKQKSVVENLRIAYQKRQNNLITEEEYRKIYNNFPEQHIQKTQAIGWFEDGGKTSKFTESYFSWIPKILPI